MSKQRTPGLTKRGEVWHIDKCVRGFGRLAESTGERDLASAESYLARRVAEIKAQLAGERVERSFAEAAARYVTETQARGRLNHRAINALDAVMPFVGELSVRMVHAGTLQPFIDDRLRAGNAPGTVNRDLAVIRRVLNLAARLWRDEQGRPWLDTPPLIPMVPNPHPARPYVLTWEEQERFCSHISRSWLLDAVLLAVNCGAREGELCALRWEWAVSRTHEGADYTLFILPGSATKNGQERVLVPNRAAQSILRGLRAKGTPTVLSQGNGKPMQRLNGTGWGTAWKAAGLPTGREWRHGPHNLRHTYGHRLRAAGVSMEHRQDLLGHKSGRGITTHYSEAELGALISASNAALGTRMAAPLRIVSRNSPAQAG